MSASTPFWLAVIFVNGTFVMGMEYRQWRRDQRALRDREPAVSSEEGQ